MSRCERTPGIVGRLLDGQQLTAAESAHSSGCLTCGPAVRRMRTFEARLGVAARALVTEPMPVRVTDTSLGVPLASGRGGLFAAAGIAAAVVIVLALAGPLRQLNPQLGAIGTPPPTTVFRAESAIALSLATEGYDCTDDIVDSKASPPVRGLVCTPPRAVLLMGAIALERSGEGGIGKVTAKALPLDKMDASFQREALGLLDVAVTMAVVEPGAAEAVRAWLDLAVTDTHPGGSRALNLEGLHLEFVRDRTGGYLLRVSAAP